MPLLRYAPKPTLCFSFIAPLLDGIGSHDCTSFRNSTIASLWYHYSIAFISSPRFDGIDTKHALLQFHKPTPTHAEPISIAIVKPLKREKWAIVLAETTSCLVVSARTKASLPHIFRCKIKSVFGRVM